MEKYVAVQEPTCTWAVLDTFADVPAEIDGRVLIGLSKAEAVNLASAANDRCSFRRQHALETGLVRLVVSRTG